MALCSSYSPSNAQLYCNAFGTRFWFQWQEIKSAVMPLKSGVSPPGLHHNHWDQSLTLFLWVHNSIWNSVNHINQHYFGEENCISFPITIPIARYGEGDYNHAKTHIVLCASDNLSPLKRNETAVHPKWITFHGTISKFVAFGHNVLVTLI